ncbi:UNVERIFIED_CONTAM: protein ALTERED XYLOGLUCAN 4-like [Sesamum angustifolium]|uniref:Protein ALTERED XYLOGLUCAN 4-like n=1 Tax=Sesamum angustifolium TaxID=2727405 RepID=A0AAW2NKR7_9LAMI
MDSGRPRLFIHKLQLHNYSILAKLFPPRPKRHRLSSLEMETRRMPTPAFQPRHLPYDSSRQDNGLHRRFDRPESNGIASLSPVNGEHIAELKNLALQVETPKAVEKDAEDRFTTWEFPKQNFTLMATWSQFLVAATERVINGSSNGGFDLLLDTVDSKWSEKLPSVDYVIFSDAHWFFRQNYLYEGGNLIGCVYCQGPNVTDLGPGLAIRKAFRAAFKAINDCKNCRKIVSFLRTYSPSHFENGTWNAGGGCNRTVPIGRDEVQKGGPDWDYRKIQIEEVETARNAGEESGNKFEILDVTEMMSMRMDGHPGLYWGNQWMKGYSDCIHWCLPGPIDVWNELLLELIKRQIKTEAGL